MLNATFRHIQGLGPLRERQLWLAGVGSWEAALACPQVLLSPKLDGRIRSAASDGQARLAAGDLTHFAQALSGGERWRLLPHVLSDAAFLDIETGRGDQVTAIGVLDPQGIRCFLRGSDLDEFPARARGWRALVTFNGERFDLPILRRAFPGWEPPAAHIDLRDLFAKVKRPGGLKKLERSFGLLRPDHLQPLTGADAVGLWEARCRGDLTALRRLVEYNLYDAFHLRPLCELGYNLALARSGMPAAPLPVTERGGYLYDVSCAVADALSRIKGSLRSA